MAFPVQAILYAIFPIFPTIAELAELASAISRRYPHLPSQIIFQFVLSLTLPTQSTAGAPTPAPGLAPQKGWRPRSSARSDSIFLALIYPNPTIDLALTAASFPVRI
jgi:hypothetical protein